MAVVNVTEKWSERGAGYDISSRTARRTFEVLLDDSETPQHDILVATGIPKYAEEYPGDFYLRVRSASIARRRGPHFVDVVVDYESIGVGVDPSVSDNPLNTPASVEWGFVDVEETTTFDAEGKPIATAAKEPIEGLTRTKSDLIMRYTINEPTFNAYLAWTFKNKLNADVFLGFPINSARCNSISGRRHWEGKSYYWEVTYEFQFRFPTWKLKALHYGNKFVGPDGKAKPCVYTSGEEKGEKMASPVLLSEDGKHYQDDGSGDITPNYREFWLHEAVSFAPLNIR